MTHTSAYIPSEDPLHGEHRRIWRLVFELVGRLSDLEALSTPSRDEQVEMRLLTDQVLRLRRQSGRICEVLRSEAHAREAAERRIRALEPGSGSFPRQMCDSPPGSPT